MQANFLEVLHGVGLAVAQLLLEWLGQRQADQVGGFWVSTGKKPGSYLARLCPVSVENRVEGSAVAGAGRGATGSSGVGCARGADCVVARRLERRYTVLGAAAATCAVARVAEGAVISRVGATEV